MEKTQLISVKMFDVFSHVLILNRLIKFAYFQSSVLYPIYQRNLQLFPLNQVVPVL